MNTIRIVANGQPFELPENSTLAAFLDSRKLPRDRVIAELNGRALPPREVPAAVLKDGDKLEIVRVVAGG